MTLSRSLSLCHARPSARPQASEYDMMYYDDIEQIIAIRFPSVPIDPGERVTKVVRETAYIYRNAYMPV